MADHKEGLYIVPFRAFGSWNLKVQWLATIALSSFCYRYPVFGVLVALSFLFSRIIRISLERYAERKIVERQALRAAQKYEERQKWRAEYRAKYTGPV